MVRRVSLTARALVERRVIALFVFLMCSVGAADTAPERQESGERQVAVTAFEVDQARAEIVRKLAELGWIRRSRNDKDVFLGPHAWHGRAYLSDNAELTFKAPIIVFRPWPKSTISAHPHSEGEPAYNDVAARSGFQANTSRKKREAVHAAVRDELEPYITRYRDLRQELIAAETHSSAP